MRLQLYARIFYAHFVQKQANCGLNLQVIKIQHSMLMNCFLAFERSRRILVRLGSHWPVTLLQSPCTCSDNYPCSLKSSFWRAYTRKNAKIFLAPSRDPIPGAWDDTSSLSTRRGDEMERKVVCEYCGMSLHFGEELCAYWRWKEVYRNHTQRNLENLHVLSVVALLPRRLTKRIQYVTVITFMKLFQNVSWCNPLQLKLYLWSSCILR